MRVPLRRWIPRFLRERRCWMFSGLAQAMPSGRVSLTGLRLTGGRDARVIITGEIQDPSAFEQMLSMLRASKVMTVDEEPVRNFKDGKSTFTINAKR